MVHENLKKIRLAKGITQVHISRRLSISNMTYSRMENGESKIDVERLKTVSMILDVDIGVFFDKELTDSVISSLKKEVS